MPVITFPTTWKNYTTKIPNGRGIYSNFFFFLFVTGSLRKNSQGETKILQRNLNGFSDILISFFLQPPAKKKITENLYWQNSEYGINARGKINGKFILKMKKNSYRCICGDAFRRRISLILRWKEKKRRCIEDSERRLSRQQTCIAKQGVTNSEVFSRARITTCTSGNLRHL